MQYTHHNKCVPCHPAGEAGKFPVQVDFDHRLKLEFHGSRITSDAGLPAYRKLDHALGVGSPRRSTDQHGGDGG